MMDYNRRWQLMRYTTGLFIREDAEWAGLPHIDLTEVSPHQDEERGNHIYGEYTLICIQLLRLYNCCLYCTNPTTRQPDRLDCGSKVLACARGESH